MRAGATNEVSFTSAHELLSEHLLKPQYLFNESTVSSSQDAEFVYSTAVAFYVGCVC